MQVCPSKTMQPITEMLSRGPHLHSRADRWMSTGYLIDRLFSITHIGTRYLWVQCQPHEHCICSYIACFPPGTRSQHISPSSQLYHQLHIHFYNSTFYFPSLEILPLYQFLYISSSSPAPPLSFTHTHTHTHTASS